MSGLARPVTDERDARLACLAPERYPVTVAAHGLSDAAAGSAPSASSLSIGGLIKIWPWCSGPGHTW